jgi:putative SOS response-associated peptidase YedK
MVQIAEALDVASHDPGSPGFIHRLANFWGSGRSSGSAPCETAASRLAGMCGRFLSLSTLDELTAQLAIDEVATEPLPRRYNVAPSTEIYAVVDRDGQRRLGTLRWGFVPPWAKSLRGGKQPINARVETVATSRMFAPSFERRRCLIPADGFYEWKAHGKGRRKQPYHLAEPDGRPLVFAGIWSSWRDREAMDLEPVFSTAIVTTEAAGEITEIHHRMPVILPETLWDDWLAADAHDAPHLLEAVRALGPPRLQATPIGTAVNDVRNDAPGLLEPVSVDG